MHNYKPSQNVRILTIRVAVPEEALGSTLADYFGGMLTSAMAGEQEQDNPILLDWEFAEPDFRECPVIKLGDMPEEGSAFARLDAFQPIKEQRQNPDACACCEMGIRKLAPDDPRIKDFLVKTIADFICRPNVEVSLTQKREAQPQFDVGSTKAAGYMVGPYTLTVVAEEIGKSVFKPSKRETPKEPEAPKTHVKLTYFKASGKYYSEGEFDTDLTFWETIKHVTRLREKGQLPGLCEGANEFAIGIMYGEGPPHFLPAKELHE